MYITVTGMEYYACGGSVKMGQRLLLCKDRNNEYDDEAIRVLSEKKLKYGYVANSVGTVARGTHSAGYIYELFDEEIWCTVRFMINDSIIAELELNDEKH